MPPMAPPSPPALPMPLTPPSLPHLGAGDCAIVALHADSPDDVAVRLSPPRDARLAHIQRAPCCH